MILIVDDMPEIVEWLGEVIQEAGYFTDYVMRAEPAFYKVQRIRYSLVLIDIILPGPMQGDELAERIHELPEPFGSTPLVAMTGGTKIRRPDLFKEILQKPFLPRNLRAVIERYADPPIKSLHLTSLNHEEEGH